VNTTRISIAMATFNGARFIAEQLDSLAAQTLLPDELVVTDDGSTDDTLVIVERFARTAPFAVQVHRNPARLRHSRNFEAAIARCVGDLIFYSDQDDVWFPDKLETVAARFHSDPRIHVVLNGQIITDLDLNHKGVTLLDNMRAFGLDADRLQSGCCTAFRKTWGDILLPIPDKADEFFADGFLSTDGWINELAILLDVRAFIEQPLQYFRRHGANTTDHILHQPNPVGMSDLIAMRLKHAPSAAWLRRAQVLELYEMWLAANRSRLEGIGVNRVDHAVQALNAEKRSLEARAALVRQPLARRIPQIWQLWRRGGYGYFYGWKSALRDISRGV
jgi:glycosyltransferase involved in cell wall biosynthesis